MPLLLLGGPVPVSTALIYAGDGDRLTWIGLGVFFVQFAASTWHSLRGIR